VFSYNPVVPSLMAVFSDGAGCKLGCALRFAEGIAAQNACSVQLCTIELTCRAEGGGWGAFEFEAPTVGPSIDLIQALLQQPNRAPLNTLSVFTSACERQYHRVSERSRAFLAPTLTLPRAQRTRR
jgi:hypothetical protein